MSLAPSFYTICRPGPMAQHSMHSGPTPPLRFSFPGLVETCRLLKTRCNKKKKTSTAIRKVVESGDLEKFDKNLAKNTNIFLQKKTREKSRKNNTENGSERRVLSTSRPRPHRLHARDSTCVFCQVKNRDSMELWQYHDTEGFVAFAFLYFSMITVYFTVIQVDSGWMRLRVEGCNSEPKWHRAFKCGTWWNWCFRFASSIDICRVFQILLCGVAFCHEIHVSLCILHTALRSENNVTGRSASHVASKAFLDLRSWGSSSRTKCHLGEGSYWVVSLDRKRKKERCHLRKIHEKDEKPYIQ